MPFVTVAILRANGVITGVLPLAGAGLAISFAISALGSALWKAGPGAGDLLFGDLLIWGFVRRWMVDRRLSSAAGLLGLRGGREKAKLSRERQAELLERLGSSLEARDPYTHGHSRRVARHAATMAKGMGLPKHEVARIRTAAAIHDVGKVKTPAEVLSKPGGLNDREYAAIQRHPVDGARMVERLRDPKLTKMVLHHHERLDGAGYPRGLRGERIPLGARIIAVADTFDAITSARPYRSAKSHRQGLDVLKAEAGTQLDPEAVEAFRGYYSGMKPVAIWAVLANLPQRFLTGVFDELGAGVASASKTAMATAATAATVVAGSAAVYAAGFSGAQAAAPVAAASGAERGSLTASPGGPGFERQVEESKSFAGDGRAPLASMAKLRESGGNAAGDGSVAGGGSNGDGGPARSTAGHGFGGGASGDAVAADEGGSGEGGGPSGGGSAGGPSSPGETTSLKGGGSDGPGPGGGSSGGGSGGNSGPGGGNSGGGGRGDGNPTTGDGGPTAGDGSSHGGGSGSENPNAHGGNPNAGGGNAGGGGSSNPDAGGGNPNAGGGNSQGSSSSGSGGASGSAGSFDSAGSSAAPGGGDSSGGLGETSSHNKH